MFRTKQAAVGWAILLGILSVSRPAQAQNYLGTHCWALDNLGDTLKVDVTAYPSQYGLVIQMRDPINQSIQFNGSGAVSLDASPSFSGTYLFSVLVTGNEAPGYDRTCGFKAHLNPGTLAGPWVLQCNDLNGTVGTNMHPVTCPAGLAPAEGPRVGDAESASALGR